MSTLVSMILGAALLSSTAPTSSTTPTTGVNKVVASESAATALWEKLLSGFGRVKGEIEIDADLLPHLAGQCRDFVIVAYKYPMPNDPTPRGTARAYGDITTGKCSYMLFVPPTRELWMEGDYDGDLASNPPGYYLRMLGISQRPERVRAGKTRVFDFRLTKGYIG
jgi:hypothetical protein